MNTTTRTFILTAANRALLDNALLADINDRASHTRVGSMGYLGTLTYTADDAVIDTDHELWDVVEYFSLHDELGVDPA